MKRLTLLDTAIASRNLGDEIIMDAVRRELSNLLPNAFTSSVPTHEWMLGRSHELVRDADYVIAGGSNLIGSRLWWPGRLANWKVGPHDVFSVKNVILMGVGWHSYEQRPGAYTRWLLRNLLSQTATHSVRDEYTRKMLVSIGFEKVVNTGCPTLWGLTPSHCGRLPRKKANTVLCTLNINRPDRSLDRKLLEVLNQHYEQVWVWIQTHADHRYCESLGEKVQYAGANIAGLHRLLKADGGIDYVGNRLHAGIRSLQLGRRSIILAIDNRATEMGGDFGLPTVGRDKFDTLSAMIESDLDVEIRLPVDRIECWKSQF